MGAMAEAKKPNNTIDKLALIVTTYKRQQLLETLFDSILALEQAPWRIVIVDNEQSDQTADMVAGVCRQGDRPMGHHRGRPVR